MARPFACTVLGTIAAPRRDHSDPPAPDPVARTPRRPVRRSLQNPSGGSGGSDATGLRLVCTPPADVRLINGATVTLQVVTARATNVLVLPVEAVAGAQGKGKVDVVKPDGTRETKDVVLGLTDGKVIEIKSGLTGDETIAVPGRTCPRQPQDQNDPRVIK
jgi:hypothetical protein